MKLICYLSNGTPTLEDSLSLAGLYAASGCDIIEIDIPARDPYLEGEYIAGLMAAALSRCDDYDRYLAEMEQIKRNNPDARLIIMIYEATVLEIGYEKFVEFCRRCGYLDLIFVGLRDDTVKNRLIADGIRVSCYVRFELRPEEIASARASNGFLYLQAKPAARTVNLAYPTLADCIRALREEHGITAPIYCGVGIHTAEDIRTARAAGADGVFVGSTILRLYGDRPALTAKIRELKAEC